MTNKEFFIQVWQSEMTITAAAVLALPSDFPKSTYRCNAKGRTASELIGHLLQHAESICRAADTFNAHEQSGKVFTSPEDAASYFEKYASLLIEKLKSVSDTTWSGQLVDFYLDENKIFSYPMSALSWTLMFDMIHHRGQLSTYYRNIGVRNPQIYGPTADDVIAAMASV